MESGCEEGRELQRVWRAIKLEVSECSNFIGEEMPEVISTSTLVSGGSR